MQQLDLSNLGSSNKSESIVNKQEGGSVKKLWGGRFTKSAEEWVDEFGASISFDQELVMEDMNWQHRPCDDACQNVVF